MCFAQQLIWFSHMVYCTITRFYFLQLFLQLVWPNLWPFYVINTGLLPYIHSKQLWTTLAPLQIWLPSTVWRSQRLGCCKTALYHVHYAGQRHWQINFDFLSKWQRPNCQFNVITRFHARYGIPLFFTSIINPFFISWFAFIHNIILMKIVLRAMSLSVQYGL